MDGELVPTAEAVVPVWTHALHYGRRRLRGHQGYRSTGGAGRLPFGEHLQQSRALRRPINLTGR